MPVRLTRELRAEGINSSAIRRLVREEDLHRIRRGAFAATLDAGAQQHLQLIRATMPRLGPGNVLSHVSAAVLHLLPVDARTLDRVTITRHPGKGGTWIGPYVHRYRTPLPEGDVEVVDGLVRTTVARTVFDLGRCIDLGFSVAAADRALRKGLTQQALVEQLDAAHRRFGVAKARTMIELADARSESAGESLSRVALWRLGLAPTELQFEVTARGNRYVADFAWPELGVLGEFDGKVKYSDLLRPGESAADVLMREKRREADLRAAGWWIVRWTYADVMQPDRLDRLVRPALYRSS
ncbi:MAG: type IV toxin-antitoxin system AbiEi family antitoxin domain-containing protein [Micropruina sp.]